MNTASIDRITTARGPDKAMLQLLSQLIAMTIFTEVLFFSGISAAYRITLSLARILSIILSVIRQW